MPRLLLSLALLPFIPWSPIAHAQAVSPTVGNIIALPERDAVALEWDVPGESSGIAYYVIAYAHSSFAHLGRSAAEDYEETYDASTSFTLRDLQNRGFLDGQRMHLAIAAVDAQGSEGSLSPEVSFTVRGLSGLPTPAPDVVPPPAPVPSPVVDESPEPVLPPPGSQADLTSPEDPTGLTLIKSLSPDRQSYTVKVTWQPSADSENDLANYNLYESGDRGAHYLGPVTVAATVLSATLTDVPAGTLTVKVTAKDRSGNESEGVEKTIILPPTGPGLTLLLSLLGAGVGTPILRLRRRPR